MEAVLEDPLILIHEKKISAMRDLIPVLEQVAREGRSLLIIAEDSRRRSPGDACREQDPRNDQGRRREGAGIW